MEAPAWTRPAVAPMHPADALRRVVYLLDRSLAPSQKAKAFQRAADVIDGLEPGELETRARQNTIEDLPGIGASTGKVITQALDGAVPEYLERLEAEPMVELSAEALPYRDALLGDCHLHSNWSDGGAPIEHMALTALALGHDYIVLTDHSPRLTVAHGLNRDRLEQQFAVIDTLNEELAPFRILRGMEVDILEDGALDMDDDMLERLDVVVGSVHSKLRMERQEMTRRIVTAVANPHVDILGHCTGRQVAKELWHEAPAGPDLPPELALKSKRPPSTFDAEIVFAACARFDTAVEINCRPERQDPPDDLLELALEWECKISVDTDAHAPGQLEWQRYGCEKAARHEIRPEQIVNTWAPDDLVDWAAHHPTD